MIGIKKILIVGFFVVVPGLLLGLGGFKVISIMSVHNRPWLLEADLRSRLAECRTGPGSTFYRKELEFLSLSAREAESCLDETGQKAWFRRDYAPCITMIMSTSMDARLLTLKLEQRKQAQKELLESFLTSMNLVLSGSEGTRKIWTGFNMTGIEEVRARSQLEQAEILYSQDEIEPAFHAALNAWISWSSHSRKNDARFSRFLDSSLQSRWNNQVDKLLQWSKKTGRRAIIVDTFGHLCVLVDKGRLQKKYKADLGRNWYQRKVQSQDASTPEGEYVITNLIPRGKYGQALMINYPNDTDKVRFQSLKRNGAIPASARIGSNIEIHGSGGKGSDWTDGCVALSDVDMRDLYRYAYKGMPVIIIGISRWTSNLKD